MARKKQREGAQINSSSMADIAFLLLIFFLVTTTIASDKGIYLILPPKPDPENPPPPVDKNQKNVFKVLVNSQDKLLVEDEPLRDVTELRDMVKEFVLNCGDRSSAENVNLYNSLPSSLRALVKRAEDSSDSPKEAVVSFKTDRGTSYEMYITVLDEIQAAYNEIYGERVGITADEFRGLDRKDPREKRMYEQARKGIPRNVSIAEPSKIGGN